jgi:hypothetical protein
MTNASIDLSALLTREQAAAELKRSIAMLDVLNRHGRLPYQRIGPKCIRILRADLDRLKFELCGELR